MSVKPARKMPSHATSCPTRIAADWVARIRSRLTQSVTGRVTDM